MYTVVVEPTTLLTRRPLPSRVYVPEVPVAVLLVARFSPS